MASTKKHHERGGLTAALARLAGRPLTGACEYRIGTDCEGGAGTLYLMGEPYIWTAQVGKAFVFNRAEDADQVLTDFRHALGSSARIIVTERTEA